MKSTVIKVREFNIIIINEIESSLWAFGFQEMVDF